jgi:hypothetical protein
MYYLSADSLGSLIHLGINTKFFRFLTESNGQQVKKTITAFLWDGCEFFTDKSLVNVHNPNNVPIS